MNAAQPTDKLILRLYVVAGAPNSSAARANLATILSGLEKERFALEIVDCITDPHRALAEGVFVTPTLMKIAPAPIQTIVGSLSDRTGVTAALGLDTVQQGTADE